MSESSYLPRIVESRLRRLFAELSAVLVVGPRASGKTTLAQRLAATTIRLDDPAVAAAVAADPDSAVGRMTTPVLIDEWQEVPSILGAIKRAVDRDHQPGRFLLTGSTDPMYAASAWPGTGRIVRVPLHCLSQRELEGHGSVNGLLATLTRGDLDAVVSASPAWSLDDYVRCAMRGGFPEPAIRLKSPGSRASWYASHVDDVVVRDLAGLGYAHDPSRLKRYLRALALSTGGLPTEATLTQAAGIDRRTATAYEDILERLFLYEPLPAWSTNRLTRLQKRSKRYVVDTGLAAAAAGISDSDIFHDGNLLGRMLDTFVAEQMRPELAHAEPRINLFHLRTDSGRHEIDMLAEFGARRVMGFEVKASNAPTRSDAVHLAWLRDRLGDDFVRGVVFHTGPMPFELDHRIWALPISSLWSTLETA